jgi:hypothetical protein
MYSIIVYLNNKPYPILNASNELKVFTDITMADKMASRIEENTSRINLEEDNVMFITEPLIDDEVECVVISINGIEE